MRNCLILFLLAGLASGGCKTAKAPKYDNRGSHKPLAAAPAAARGTDAQSTPR
jgi:hypothetical protein